MNLEVPVMKYLLRVCSVVCTSLIVSAVLAGCTTTRGTIPPVVTLRDIANMERIAQGETIQLSENAWLFLPRGYEIPSSGEFLLTVHFHDAVWFAIEEHARRGVSNPLLIYSGLVGSSAYRAPFESGTLFAELMGEVENQLRAKGASANPHVGEVEISSFSAGYGAVREILKNPDYVEKIRSVVLADSMYASYIEPGVDHRPLPEQMVSFIEYARLAVKGEKTFVVAYSSVHPGNYASTAECAAALVEALGGRLKPVAAGSLDASAPALDYPLIARYDRRGLHVWGYACDDPKAHMAQARALADFWLALNQ